MSSTNLLRLACGMVLGVSASVASAAFINFIENLDEISPVAVTTNLTGNSGGPPSISATPESASVDGFHFPAISPNPVEPGVRSAGLLEPGSNLLSDLVIIEALPITNCPAIETCQQLIITFYSDTEGGPPLETLIPRGSFRGAIPEDGSLQDISALLGTLPEGLIVRVQSDPSVPEPAALFLLAGGLGALAARRRKPGLRGQA